ncbi:MAG: hypothetical protein JOZ51_14585 [Chloroflexi bacterium]|nr:hypothetical protein [Chloroflexota bacterium]
MAKEPKYRATTRRELPETRWRLLGITLALLGLGLVILLGVAVLVALGVISG